MTVTFPDDADRILRGGSAIAAVIGRKLPATYYALENGHYCAWKRGGVWESTPRRLLGPPPPRADARRRRELEPTESGTTLAEAAR